MSLSHDIAIQVLEEELELTIAIIKYYDISKNKLAKEGFNMSDASYRHWAINRVRMQKNRVGLEYTLKFLKAAEKKGYPGYEQQEEETNG